MSEKEAASMSNRGYCFPCMFDYTDSNASNLQSEMRKLYEELGELESAMIDADEHDLFDCEQNQKRFNVVVEVVDCMHVCESILRLLNVENSKLCEYQNYVELKNELRGYYD